MHYPQTVHRLQQSVFLNFLPWTTPNASESCRTLWTSTSLTMHPSFFSVPSVYLYILTHISILPKSTVDTVINKYITLNTQPPSSKHMWFSCRTDCHLYPLGSCFELWIAPGTLSQIPALSYTLSPRWGRVRCPEAFMSYAIFYTSFNSSFQPTLDPQHSSPCMCRPGWFCYMTACV